jgi:ATP-dependent DNA helicase DinG
VLDKIPFAPPTDPIVAARCAMLDQDGGSGFSQYTVPCAATTLKQGFGRLIRTQRDVGVVAILDRRIVRRGYGRALLAALPPARRVRTFEDLRSEWDRLAAFHEANSPNAVVAVSPAFDPRGIGGERTLFAQSDLRFCALESARAND